MDDCGPARGVGVPIAEVIDGQLTLHENVESSVYARNVATDVVAEDGTVLATAAQDIGDREIRAFIAAGIETVKVRSVLTCESAVGVCAHCYGRSLATGKLVDIGEAVGIIAAQSIGEPGTQLTMRTFHTGGSVGASDITQGLPRVTELFEARTPKNASPIAEVAGRVRIEEDEKSKRIVITPDNGDEEIAYPVLRRATLEVGDGDHVEQGEQLQVGAVDPKEVLRVRGVREVQKHLVSGVQDVYRSQGVPIHDKHIEVIVRQMLRKVTVVDHGETDLLPGELVDRSRYNDLNRAALTDGKKTASARQEVMGITKASLATESWLSAASFQETTKVLTEAALAGKRDPLLGLKENVIIGKLIPAGTGLSRYRDVSVEATEEAKAERYPNRLFADAGGVDESDLSYLDFDAFTGGEFGEEPGQYV